MLVLSFQTFSVWLFFVCFCLLVYLVTCCCCWKLARKYLVKGIWTGSHRGFYSWVSAVVCCSLYLPVCSGLPHDLGSLTDIRKVTDFQFVQLLSCDDSKVPYTPDQKLEVWFHCFCVLPPPSFLPSLPCFFLPFFFPSFLLCRGPLLFTGWNFAKVATGQVTAQYCPIGVSLVFFGRGGELASMSAGVASVGPWPWVLVFQSLQIQRGLLSLNLAVLYFFGTYQDGHARTRWWRLSKDRSAGLHIRHPSVYG